MLRRDFLTLGLTSMASAALPPETVHAAAAALPRMQARMSDSICESYLVNTKFFFKDTVYGHTDAVINLLEDLGVRIVRERITTGTSIGTRKQQHAMLQLAKHGIRWHATVGNLSDWRRADQVNRDVMRHLANYYKPRLDGDLSAMLHSFGGCNEIDGFPRDPQWAKHGRIMQKALWRATKGNAATRHIPVAGPSTRTDITRRRASDLGDLSAWSDWANGHIYNRGNSPTREIDEHMRILRRCFPDAKRWIFTETGYNDSPQDNLGFTVPKEAAAIYVVRGICDFFKCNAIYGRFELLDDPDAINYATQVTINNTAEREAHFGLVEMTKDTIREATPDTWRKKPEYQTTRRFLHLMADRGRSFSPDPLRLDIAGGRKDLQRVLVQKRNGRHYLLLWRDVDVYTHYPEADPIPVDPYTVTLRLGTQRPSAVFVPRQDDRPVATHPPRSRIRVPVGKNLVVVRLG